MQVKLAEALLRRKELQQKVDQLKSINAPQLFQMQVQRIKVSDGLDEVTAKVPRMTASQVTEEYDFYAKQLRLCDAAIQQANWQTEIAIGNDVMTAFSDRVKPQA